MPQMREITKSLLLQQGYQHFFTANDGDEAFNILEKHPVDIVIADLIMPKVDGLALLQKIRQSQRFMHLPFILATGENDEKKLQEVANKGINGFLSKPFSMSEMEQVLCNIFDPNSPLRIKNRQKLSENLKFIQLKKKANQLEGSILIVDDNAMHITQMASLLEENYHVKVAKSAKSAMKVLEEDPNINLLIVDIKMPDISGFQWIDYLKRQDQFKQIPVIFVSGLKDKKTVLRAYKLGGVDFLSKPFEPELLLTKVNIFMDYKNQIENLNRYMELMFLQLDSSQITRERE